MRYLQLIITTLLVLNLAACQRSSAGIKVLTHQEHENLNLPFSEAVKTGGLIFISGQIGTKPGSLEIVPGDIKVETHQVMNNIKTILERYGSSMNDVAKCTVFIKDISLWADMNTVYVSYFPNHKPARSAVGVNEIALGGNVEIECIATTQDK